jgi:hypothetical protein
VKKIIRSKLKMEQVNNKEYQKPQEGLSPPLWSLVIDKLLTDLDSQRFEAFGLVNDTVTMV